MHCSCCIIHRDFYESHAFFNEAGIKCLTAAMVVSCSLVNFGGGALELLYKENMGLSSQFCVEKHYYIQCQVIIVQEVATC